jgi:hypothetical protein
MKAASSRVARIKGIVGDLALLIGIICACAMIQNLLWALVN